MRGWFNISRMAPLFDPMWYILQVNKLTLNMSPGFFILQFVFLQYYLKPHCIFYYLEIPAVLTTICTLQQWHEQGSRPFWESSIVSHHLCIFMYTWINNLKSIVALIRYIQKEWLKKEIYFGGKWINSSAPSI